MLKSKSNVQRAVGLAKASLLESPRDEPILATDELIADEGGDEIEPHFSSLVGFKVFFAPDGSARDVKITKSSRVADVDR